LENPFFATAWPGVAVWVVLYISDYALTIKCARLYKMGVSEKLVFEGSYELTPYFQRDINSLRIISPRFIVMLIYSSVLLTMIWMLSLITYRPLYAFALGAMVLIELTIHLRHLHNFFMFRAIIRSDAASGRIEYTRMFILRGSATDLAVFSVFYLILAGLLQNWFFLGGAATCLSTAVKHLKLARQHSTIAAASPQSADS
jgi:hypothetical protein